MSVSILSLNLFLRPPFVRTNSSDFKNARTEYFINHILGSHDVYCLQEVFETMSYRKARIIKAAVAKGYLHIAESPSPRFFSTYLIDGGLLVLSRLPILENQFRTYSVRELPDSYSQKGLLYCKLLVHGAFVHIITTHTQSSHLGTTVRAFYAQRYSRRQQLREIRQFIDSHNLASEFCLILGDLNVDAREALRPAPAGVDLDDDYGEMMKILQASSDFIDILRQKYGESPATFARVTASGEPEETVLTDPGDFRMQLCLDYILALNMSQTVSLTQHFEVNWDRTSVDTMFVKGCDFSQLSDHCAVEICLDHR
jgi:hypothetical protein